MTTLLERDEQLDAATGYLADAATGHGRLVYVGGEAGVGKTAFLEDVAAHAGTPVAIGWCDGSATPPPLAPLVDMLPDLPSGTWPDDASRSQVFANVLGALREPPGGVPYLLVIEDAHWADEATLDLVRHLARRIHACRALVMVSYRPEDTTAGDGLRVLLGDTATATGTRRIDLSPLTADGVAKLAAEHGSSAADVSELYAVTGGNPFFVTEALAAAGELPQTVRDAVLARVSRLDETGQRALELVALAGARAEADLVGDLLHAGLTALDEPLARGLLRRSGRDVLFRHELARRAVAGEIPAGRAVHLHRRLLAALQERGADPARLAHHADAAGDGSAVLHHARAAAASAAVLGAHREASRQYERALRHADDLPPDERAQLLWDLGYEFYLTSRIEESIETVGRARELWDALGDSLRVGDAWRCQSRLQWFAGRNEEAREDADRAVDLLEGTGSVEQAMALSNRAGLAMLSTKLAPTREWGRRTLAVLDTLPPGVGQDEVRVHALNNLGTIEVTAGDFDSGQRMLEESLAGARGANLQEHAARAYCNLASTAVAQRRHADAFRWLEEGLTYCTDRDLDSWTSYLTAVRSRLHLDRSEEAEARADAAAVLRGGSSAVGSLDPLLVVAQLDVRTGTGSGDEGFARAVELSEAMREAQRIGPTAAARCEAAWIAGDAGATASIATDAWALVSDVDCPWHRGQVATWLPAEVDAGLPLAPPYALERQGSWSEAADYWQGVESPFEQALALARSGEEELLTQAVRIFDRLGATAAGGRARTMLQSLGAPVPRATRASSHPHGLTRREQEVLELVVRGLGDAAIAETLVISRRTAEHHVASILGKVGVRSRRDLEIGGGDATSG